MKDLYIESASKSDRMKELIRESILSGDLQPADQLPSEPELIRKYHVSRGTIREAIVSLVHEGLLYRIQGKGTFVADRPPFRPTIAIVLPYLFFNTSAIYSAGTDVIPLLVQAVEAEARRLGMNILLYLDNYEAQIERANIADLLERKVDGILLYYVGGQENRDCLMRLRDTEVPVVMIDRHLEDNHHNYVVTDNVLGAYQAAKYLLTQGFRDLFYITSPLIDSALQDRYAGYCQALSESGLSPQVLYVDVDSAYREPEETRACRRAKEMLKTIPSAPFAVLAADAPTLVGVWQAISQEGIPLRNFELACFDEPFLILPAGVKLTKILQPLQEIGRVAAEIMWQCLTAKRRGEEPPPCRQIKLEPTLVLPADRDERNEK